MNMFVYFALTTIGYCYLLLDSVVAFDSNDENAIRSKKRQALINCQWPCSTMSPQPICSSGCQMYPNNCQFELARCMQPDIRIMCQAPCPSPCPPTGPLPIYNQQPFGNLRMNDSCLRDCSQSGYESVCDTDGRRYTNQCYFDMAQCYAQKQGQRIPQLDPTCMGTIPSSPSNYGSLEVSGGTRTGGGGLFGGNLPAGVNVLPGFGPAGGFGPGSERLILPGNQGQGQFGGAGDRCFKNCEVTYRPVCGNDGVTYNNLCHFQIAQCRCQALGRPLELRGQGACEDLNDGSSAQMNYYPGSSSGSNYYPSGSVSGSNYGNFGNGPSGSGSGRVGNIIMPPFGDTNRPSSGSGTSGSGRIPTNPNEFDTISATARCDYDASRIVLPVLLAVALNYF